MYKPTAVLNAALSVWQNDVGEFVVGEFVGESVGFNKGLAVGESMVGFDEGLAVGESVVGFDEGLAVGESVVGFNEGLTVVVAPVVVVGAAVATTVGFLVGAAMGRMVGAMGSPLRHALLICPPKAPLQYSRWLL